MNDKDLFWSDELSTGVEEIDNDHRALFQIFEDAYWVCQCESEASELYLIISNLINYTEVHFAREEALMAVSHYPLLDKHRAIHQQLIRELIKQVILTQKNQQTPSGFVLYLKDWFIGHINGLDKEIRPYTQKNLDKINFVLENIGPLIMEPYCHIFIVDDDKLYVDLLREMSVAAGLTATAFSSSIDFLQASISTQDIIVLDLNMPDKDGIEVMRELADKNIKPTFILISGFDERVLQSARLFAESRQLHVAEILTKPVETDNFIALLQNLNKNKVLNYINSQVIKIIPSAKLDLDSAENSINNEITIAELTHGLEQHEFIIHLQPQVKFSDGSLCGVEALIRWQHPEKGLIYPDQIIPLFEKHKLMSELTQTVIFESVKACRLLKRAGLFPTISINISAQNLTDLTFPEQLDVLLKTHNLSPEQFTLELTESEILTDTSMALDILNRLRIKGFSLSIDDFGTGDSSLKKLYESPFSELKIDQYFVSRMVNDHEANAIVRVCTTLANEFSMTTVAEGVETQEVWDKLRDLGCSVAQGYFISKPLPIDQLISWAQTQTQTPSKPYENRLHNDYQSG